MSGWLGMPVADTELLFLLNPRDPRHKAALRILEELKGKLRVPDTALIEFEVTLRSRGRSLNDVKQALLALKRIMEDYGIEEVSTIDLSLLVRHVEIMLDYSLDFFDSLIAASALSVDGIVVSDDKAFDRVEELKRIPIVR